MAGVAAAGRQFVFGYASLTAEHGGAIAALRGHRRVWGVAMDNSRDLPGYKHYLLRSDGSRPGVFVAFLDIVEDPGCTVNGVLLAVDAVSLDALDRRERNYERIDVSDAVEAAPSTDAPATEPGTVWSYTGKPEARARLRDACAAGRAVVQRDYLDAVTAGFAALGAEQLHAFERSTSPCDLPAWDLERVDSA